MTALICSVFLPQEREISIPMLSRSSFLYRICIPAFLKGQERGNANPGTRAHLWPKVRLTPSVLPITWLSLAVLTQSRLAKPSLLIGCPTGVSLLFGSTARPSTAKPSLLIGSTAGAGLLIGSTARLRRLGLLPRSAAKEQAGPSCAAT